MSAKLFFGEKGNTILSVTNFFPELRIALALGESSGHANDGDLVGIALVQDTYLSDLEFPGLSGFGEWSVRLRACH
jgi:hypothetical protein